MSVCLWEVRLKSKMNQCVGMKIDIIVSCATNETGNLFLLVHQSLQGRAPTYVGFPQEGTYSGKTTPVPVPAKRSLELK